MGLGDLDRAGHGCGPALLLHSREARSLLCPSTRAGSRALVNDAARRNATTSILAKIDKKQSRKRVSWLPPTPASPLKANCILYKYDGRLHIKSQGVSQVSILSALHFHNESAAIAKLEAIVWPK